MTGIPPESGRSFYLELKVRILQKMRQQGVEESIRKLLHESFEKALSNLDALPMLSGREHERLRKVAG